MARRTAEEAAATRADLVAAGRRLFVEHGYSAVSAEAIVAAAGVTRGALYHHFDDKRALFEAVHADALAIFDREVSAAGLAAAERTGELWPAFWAGTERYLDLCVDPELARILLLDAPVALGWQRWEERDFAYSVPQFSGILELLMTVGEIEPQPLEPLSRVLVGVYNQVGRLIATADDPAAARQLYGDALRGVLAGIAPRSTYHPESLEPLGPREALDGN